MQRVAWYDEHTSDIRDNIDSGNTAFIGWRHILKITRSNIAQNVLKGFSFFSAGGVKPR